MPDPMVLPRRPRSRGATARSTTWWGRAFVRSFEELTLDADDLTTARSLARSGRLGAIVVLDTMASAAIDPGSDRSLMAQVRVQRLAAEGWSAFVREAARENGFVAALEAGDLPADLVEHADELGVEVLPGTAAIDTACDCDAWTQPCVHALALLYQVAWHVDTDPYVLLLLRGRTRERLLEELEAVLASAVPAVEDDADLADVRERAARILELAGEAPTGHGLADAGVASYDEQVARLLES